MVSAIVGLGIEDGEEKGRGASLVEVEGETRRRFGARARK